MLKIQNVSTIFTIIFFFAILDICMIQFHRQEYEIEKLHWKFEVNYSNTSWDIAFAMTVIGHFQTFEKNSFKFMFTNIWEFIILKPQNLNESLLKVSWFKGILLFSCVW